MKTKFVQDLEPNDKIVSFFLVHSKEIRFKKNSGEPYLSLLLSDRTGQIEAKMWDGVEEVEGAFSRDDFVKIKANVQLYRDKPQLVIQKLRKAEESEVDLSDYIPHTRRDVEEMLSELRSIVNGFSNPHLERLLRCFLDDEEVVAGLRCAPAAKSLHHACVGGLLEHMLSLLRLAKLVASNYDYIDVDLLLTGVVLHDIGKIHELSYERSFNYTTEGQLIGHIGMALQLIDRKCAGLEDFPPRLKVMVEHMVLSHHGKYEFGSPKLPMFPEALALAYLDDLDSKLESMRAAIDGEPAADGEWTRFNPSLERAVLNAPRYLARPEGVQPAHAVEPAPGLEASPPPLPETGGTSSLFGQKLRLAWGDRSESDSRT